MLIPLSWIKKYVELSVGPDELAHLLTMSGLESVNHGSPVPDIKGLITARIEKIERHPDADKLTVCQVTAEEGKSALTVVCGAPNIQEGNIVPLALPGTKLPDGTELKRSKIRGIESNGMMCSQRELGMGDDHSGIWILPPGTPIGQPLAQAIGADDAIIECEPTPNRGDLMSVVNIAREIGAITGGKVTLPEFQVTEEGDAIEDQAKVEIENFAGCPRYVARLIRGVKIGPSPDWMVKRLEACGMRSINNIVDVTNYVMLELGQPLHAFDYNQLRGHRIVVKNAKAGDKFKTLDGIEQTLRDDTLMICDGEGQVAIAGVMGGLDSEVSENTVDILLEAAYFTPTVIRRTARILNIPTEASRRFDKGVDPLGTRFAADRAIELMREVAGGQIARGVIDVKESEYRRKEIRLRPERVSFILGHEIDTATQKSLLGRLHGLELSESGGEIKVAAPSYRPDLTEEIDLVEEVARLYGYNNIPDSMPCFTMEPLRRQPGPDLARRLRERLAALGFSEVVQTNFEDPKRLALMGLPASDPRMNPVRLANPLSENESILRSSLLPKLLAVLAMNRSRGVSEAVRMYEINAAFFAGGDTGEQKTMLAGLYSPELDKALWSAGKRDGFYDLKGVVEEILAAVGFGGARIEPDPSPDPFLHPGKAARVVLGNIPAGTLGELHPVVAEAFELRNKVFIFDLSFDMLVERSGGVPKAKPISKFPPTLRDIAVVVDESVTMEDIVRSVRKLKSKYLEDVSLFDVFRGGNLPAGKKSMAFHVRYQSLDRTLTDEDVNREHSRLTEQLQRSVGAELR